MSLGVSPNISGPVVQISYQGEKMTSTAQEKAEVRRTIPFLLQKREEIPGRVQVNTGCSDDSTYMGATQGGGADYESD